MNANYIVTPNMLECSVAIKATYNNADLTIQHFKPLVVYCRIIQELLNLSIMTLVRRPLMQNCETPKMVAVYTSLLTPVSVVSHITFESGIVLKMFVTFFLTYDNFF